MDYKEYQILLKFREELTSEIKMHFDDAHNNRNSARWKLEMLNGMQRAVVLLDQFIKKVGE